MNLSSSFIQNIPASAHLAALYRAMETERSDALFHDPYARLLAGPLGVALTPIMTGIDDAANIIAVRTYLIDEMILDLLSSDSVDTIISLGAGLDTRPYRLPLPKFLRWIEVDLPDLLSYKEEQLSHIESVCTLERVILNLHNIEQRQSLFKTLKIQAKKTLVLTEGLLAYFYPTQVAALAQDLYQQNSFCWWLFELICLPVELQLSQLRSPHKPLDYTFGIVQPAFQFLPEEGTQFFYPYGWRVCESRSILNEMEQLNRIEGLTQLWKPLSRWIYKESWQVFSQRVSVVLMEKINNGGNPQQSKNCGGGLV